MSAALVAVITHEPAETMVVTPVVDPTVQTAVSPEAYVIEPVPEPPVALPVKLAPPNVVEVVVDEAVSVA